MEEAVTDTIVKGATQRIESFNQVQQENDGADNQGPPSQYQQEPVSQEAYGGGVGVGVVNVETFVKENQHKNAAAQFQREKHGSTMSHKMEERKGEEEDNILTEDPGLIFRPICSLGGESNNQQF